MPKSLWMIPCLECFALSGQRHWPDCSKASEDNVSTELRDEVIAGLRERGWPEPEIVPDVGSAWWPSANPGKRPWVTFFPRWGPYIHQVGYGLDGEGGHIDVLADASRIIEAIDRLRWVIGLPPQRMSRADFYKLPFWTGGETWNVPAGTPRRQFLLTDAETGLVPLTPSKPEPDGRRPGRSVLIYDKTHRTIRRVTPLGEMDGAQAGQTFAAQVRDTDAGLVPMTPSKPEPKADPPYEPNRWGEHD
jgi:hypothetical protein